MKRKCQEGTISRMPGPLKSSLRGDRAKIERLSLPREVEEGAVLLRGESPAGHEFGVCRLQAGKESVRKKPVFILHRVKRKKCKLPKKTGQKG